jgi:hypothetical protein
VSLAGNSVLPVVVARRLSTGNYANATGAFGRWELEIPRLHGVFSNVGWVTKTGLKNRCNDFGKPAGANGVGGVAAWSAHEFWHGNFIYVPGVGDQEMLLRNDSNAVKNIPSGGGPYPVVTRDLWSFSCLPRLANDPDGTMGEGFLAVAPDGTQYRFDQLVTRSYQGVSRSEDMSAPSITADTGSPENGVVTPGFAPSPGLGRTEVWILPTRVTDRFGNYVTYTYNPNKPGNVTDIASSDGRKLTMTYVTDTFGDRIKTVSDGTRTWTYAYTTTSDQTNLDYVNLPDGSRWDFTNANALLSRWFYVGSGSCDELNTVADGPKTGTMSHPTGALGTFTLSPVRHGRSHTFRLCWGDPYTSSYAIYPHKFDIYSLTNKTLSGPGLSSMTWAYDYGPDNGSWEGCEDCMDTVTTSVTDPKGDVTRYTYGNRYRQTEGRLVSVDTDGLRTVTMHYRDAGAGPYPLYHGTSDQKRGDGEMNARYTPMDQRVTTQQGVDFTWRANSFDNKARPTAVTRFSTLGFSRTETTAYFDQEAKWVLGRVKSVTEPSTGKAMVSTEYDAATAMPLNVRRFGQLDRSYTYYTDGTLATRKDGLNQTTSYANYKRGLAQNVRHADGTTESAIVNELGLVTSVTRQTGAGATVTTSYGYDAG